MISSILSRPLFPNNLFLEDHILELLCTIIDLFFFWILLIAFFLLWPLITLVEYFGMDV